MSSTDIISDEAKNQKISQLETANSALVGRLANIKAGIKSVLIDFFGQKDEVISSSDESLDDDYFTPLMLKRLGWILVNDDDTNQNITDMRWIDPNDPQGSPQTTTYAWYVSQLRVQNRTDTKYLKLTNSDLADIVSN